MYQNNSYTHNKPLYCANIYVYLDLYNNLIGEEDT